ncbi:MAG: EFR1 family ferrodoxin [bacterium]
MASAAPETPIAAYNHLDIYYLSGTGNTRRAALIMAEQAAARGLETSARPIESVGRGDIAVGAGRLVGLMLPAHAFTSPWSMIRFALRMPPGRGAHAFVICTRGSVRIFKTFFPGMEGTAVYLIALILLLRGYSVRGGRGLNMPSNWTSLHSAMLDANNRAIIARNRSIAEQFINRLLDGRRFYGSLVCLLIGLAISPVSIAYLLAGRFGLAKLFFASYRCNGCGQCAKECPNHAIIMAGPGKKQPYWTFDCESCMRCMGYCPEKAIEAGHSIGIIFYFLTAPFFWWLIAQFAARAQWFRPFAHTLAATALQFVFSIISFWFAYLVINRLIRNPVINRLFTWTTLTFLYRRYREPDTSLRDFHQK